MREYLDILTRNWSPEIGDPTIMGWLTVAAYFTVAILLAIHAGRAPILYPGEARAHRRFLLGLCAIMLFLGVNKQLDLQTYLTRIGRDVAQLQGWYQGRRKWQALFVAAIALAGITLAWLVLRGRLGTLGAHRWTLAGMVLLLAFIVIRASSFNQVDKLINQRWGDIRGNWIFELGGLGLIGLSTALAILPKRSARRSGRN